MHCQEQTHSKNQENSLLVAAPVLPFNDYLCNAYILVNYH